MNDQDRSASSRDAAASADALPSTHIFQAAVHKTRMAMALADPNLPDCPLVYVNPAFCAMTGYAPDEAVGRNCRFLQGPETDRDMVARIRRTMAERENFDEEIYNYRKNGSGFWNALFMSPVFNDDGSLQFYFASQIDVTHRKEAEARQLQRMESIGALASGVAHEFSNLMTVVLGSVERAASGAVDERQTQHLGRAEWAARRAGQLSAELLTLARRQSSAGQAVDLNAVIDGFAGTLAQVSGAAARFRLALAPMVKPVRLEPGQLELVLLNLARNAADAMPDGGELVVGTRLLPAPEAMSVLRRKEAVELFVSDTGTGMSPTILARATEPFFTTKATGKGTGLGLFLALEFVDQSAGKLLVDSKIGHGTVMRMIFPVAADA